MCVLSFADLFLSNELLNIRACHFTVLPDSVIIRLPRVGLAYVEKKARVYLDILHWKFYLPISYWIVLILSFLLLQSFSLETLFFSEAIENIFWVTGKFLTLALETFN